MGLLVDGVWKDTWYDTKKTGGRFVRQDSSFRNWITADGSPGPTGTGGFKAERGRYHLYVSLACPWAHRTLIFRTLKRLETAIDVSAVDPLMLENGWTFSTPEPVNGASHVWQIYTAADPGYSGRATVPILWDKKTGTIVSNESSEIIRMFNSAFDHLTGSKEDYYPVALRPDIDEINETVYENVNNGVYKAGFATGQPAYDEAVSALFETLDRLEERLSHQRYLVGDRITEADWRLFTTLVRFDPVYVGHFKCNLRRLSDYPALSSYVRDLYQVPGVAGTVDLEHVKRHYYGSHRTINPTGIVPQGPIIDYSQPHDRARLAA
ncbi:glutathione S-transferase family protein [Polymorphum gilvum]|uniref:Glutathione S-transferase domain-containing protein n=1 Tax=Polymorphum gilvum (strain LMG 25793 / CGMCC 1.9160 / SL003B-26A1) TaxID=991905 RepID=F2IZM7_POLGS|nr:glutathione S-transferase family protein [Polymorphum gilvum]ADZ69584.1 Glutathione S-transferase domain-containing protein [Polymorphum gilvum SL003B-26A1]